MKQLAIGVLVVAVLGFGIAVLSGAIRLGPAGVSSGGGSSTPVAKQATPSPGARVTASGDVIADGRVVPKDAVNLSFTGGGTVAEVLVKEGGSVEAGQVVGRLDNSRQAAAVSRATADLAKVKANLADLRSGSRAQEIASARAGVASAQAKLRLVEQGARAEDVASAKAAVDSAQAKYDQLKASPTEAEVRGAEQGVASAQATLEKAQADLAKLKAGATAEDVRGAEIAVEQAQSSLLAAQADRDGVCANSPKYACDAGNAKVQAAEIAIASARNNLAKVRAGPRASDVAAGTAAVASAQADVAAAQAKLRQVRAGATAQDLAVAQAAVVQAVQAYQLKQQPYTAADVDAAKAEVDRAQAQLELLEAGTRPEVVAAAEADVTAAEAAVEDAKLGVNERELRSPLNGVVAYLSLKKGELVSPGVTVARLVDLSGWQVETTNLTELDITRVREGNAVGVKFASIPGLELPGKVAAIRSIGEKVQGDLTYTIVVSLDRQDPRLLWNMSATVTIDTGSAN